MLLGRYASDNLHRACKGYAAERVLRDLEAAAPAGIRKESRHTYEFSGIVPDCNGSVFTVSLQPAPAGATAFVELLLFALRMTGPRIANQWRAKLPALFPESAS